MKYDGITRIIGHVHVRYADYARNPERSSLTHSTTSASSVSGSFAGGLDAPVASDTLSSCALMESRSNFTTVGVDINALLGRPHSFTGGRGAIEPRTARSMASIAPVE